MFFGSNLQILCRRSGIIQEQLGPADGCLPPDRFHCLLDDLLRQNLSVQTVPMEIRLVKGFSMAQYTIISPNAEADLQTWMESWATRSGLIPGSILYLSWSFRRFFIPAVKGRNSQPSRTATIPS